MNDVTQILAQVRQGDEAAVDSLLRKVYTELRRLAAAKLSRERPGQTLQATALVHEAYLRLLGSANTEWENSAHFFGAAAEAMRRILVEAARRKGRIKHGGNFQRQDLDERDAIVMPDSPDLIALDEALEKLAAEDPGKAKLVELRYFAGLTVEQAARVMGISRATADRHWAFVRAWLYQEMTGGD